MDLKKFLMLTGMSATMVAGTAHSGVSAEEAAKLCKELTCVGAIKAGNAEGTIPEHQGEKLFNEEQKNLKWEYLQKLKDEDPQKLVDIMLNSSSPDQQEMAADFLNEKPSLVITAQNMGEHSDKLTEGHKALLQKYPTTYKMNVYKTYRPSFFPEKIYEETVKNAMRATLQGTDSVQGAELGFPFPIPKQGAEVLWNHKLKFRGAAAVRYNDQIIVKADGEFKYTKVQEEVMFVYANLENPVKAEDMKLLAYYMAETQEPPRLAGQLVLVHETADQDSGGRKAWIYSPATGRVNRAPDVGFDNPSVGTDGEQFNDQVDMYNGAQTRYTWKLVGRKEMYVSYNAATINDPRLKYADMVRKGHVNTDLPRYELHRIWVVEANLREGVSHQLKKRVFYVDEDSWSISAVDGYDNRDQLWKFQEAHMITAPMVPTTTGAPEVIHDLQSGRYFMTALTNEGDITNFNVKFKAKDFKPAAMKRRIK